MRKITIITIALVLAIPAILTAQDYPPAGWTADINDAIVRAEAEDKMILLDFTGSDWCGWCHKLDAEVWNTTEFEEYADENLILVFLDFPRGITLDEDQQYQNYVLQQMLGVQGYPTVWLLDSDLTPLLKTGYRDGGAEAYIAHLENDRIPVPAEQAANFRTAFRDGLEETIGPIG